MKELSDGVSKIFDEREKFIIVGLTGRTGSGCSTVADILSKKFEEIEYSYEPPEGLPKYEKIRHKIIHSYAKSNWSVFHVVRIKDIITSFILEKNIESFIQYIGGKISRQEDVCRGIPESIQSDFELLHAKRLEIKKLIETKKDEALSEDKVYEFYIQELPKFTDILKACLDGLSAGGFTRAYQLFGNNIRTSGSAYDEVFNPDHIFMLAQRTNVIVKILRRKSLIDNRRVLVCIDSIRNPYEASFFKDRYSSFYLFAITTTEDDRQKRLREDLKLNDDQINRLDSVEYPNKLKGYEKFTSLNIQECIQAADVHLFNPTMRGKCKISITSKVVKYVTLIMHPGLVTPSKEERLMQQAHNAKLNSGCISRQVGAVVTDSKYSIKSVGWNDAAHGQVPCSLRNSLDLIAGQNLDIFSDYEANDEKFRSIMEKTYLKFKTDHRLDGRSIPFCFKDVQNCIDGEKNQVHTRALHAEENAFLQLIKSGSPSIEGGMLFTTASPCELCSKKAYQLGIEKIFFIDPYPGIANTHILGVGEKRPKLKLFEGAIGRAYLQLFQPIMPVKDELSLLLGVEVDKG